MDNGLAIMPAPIFLVTDDPRATAGLEGDGHLLDVCRFLLDIPFLPANIHAEGQLSSCHVRRYGTDYDQRLGDSRRNSRSVFQRVNYLQSYTFPSISISTQSHLQPSVPRISCFQKTLRVHCRPK